MIVLQVNGYVPIRLGFLDVGDGVAAPVTPRENGVMENVGDRPRRVELVCGDCGRALNPAEAFEVRLAENVMKVCQSCFATRKELDRLLG